MGVTNFVSRASIADLCLRLGEKRRRERKCPNGSASQIRSERLRFGLNKPRQLPRVTDDFESYTFVRRRSKDDPPIYLLHNDPRCSQHFQAGNRERGQDRP